MKRLGALRASSLSFLLIAALFGPGHTAALGRGLPDRLEAGAGDMSAGWPLQAQLALGQPSSGDSVALSANGNIALVGVPLAGSGRGLVHVFSRQGTTWTDQHEIQADSATPARRFGAPVAVSADGSTAVVGATGAAYIFKWDGTAWRQQVDFKSSVAPDRVGESVAISGDGSTVLVGASGMNGSVGAVTVLTGAPSWGTTQTLMSETPTSYARNGHFGWSLALSDDGSTALIGAPQVNQGDNQYDGMAYLFHRSGTTWSQELARTVLADNRAARDFGWSVALSADGSTALVGSLLSTDGSGGTAYVYKIQAGTAAWSWQRLALLRASDSAAHDNFGQAVALSADGSSALIGAPYAKDRAGAAYVFRGWSQQAELIGAGLAQGSYFGAPVGLSRDGSIAVVVAGFARDAYVFSSAGAQATATPAPPSPTPTPAAVFSSAGYTPGVFVDYYYLQGHRAIMGNGWLSMHVLAAPGVTARFTVSLHTGAADARTTVFTGSTSAVADSTGAGSARIRITYDPPSPELALLTVTATMGESTSTQRLGVLVFPG